MKLSDAAKQYEECMKEPGPCLMRNCPLYKEISIQAGSPDAEWGQLTLKIEGCSLMGRFSDFLRKKKPGEPIDEED